MYDVGPRYLKRCLSIHPVDSHDDYYSVQLIILVNPEIEGADEGGLLGI